MQSTNSNIQADKRPQHGVKNDIVVEGEGQIRDNIGGFRFGRMFPSTNSQPLILKLSACQEIGERMTAQSEAGRADSQLPAGYTYFGQFVDHDISFDGTDEKVEGDDLLTDPVESTADNDLVQNRSPSLDLDSLYGGPDTKKLALFNGAKFKIGKTTPSPNAGLGPVSNALPYDLPRKLETRNSKRARIANIGDPRNDENLAVAQTHLMWLKFHNAIVDQLLKLAPERSQERVFAEARELVTKHYQYVVLHDFIRRIISEDAYKDIIVGGNRKILKQCPGEVAFMPLEFSVAVYRYGHSQVREEYDWNVNFGTGSGVLPTSSFRLLFEFSELSGNFGGAGATLPTNWIADFRRLFDFGEMDFPNLKGSVETSINLAKSIDPFLAPALSSLPEVEMLVAMGLRPFANLAGLNLRRGSMRALPSGQDIATELGIKSILSKQQMVDAVDDEFNTSMEKFCFYDRTPLWLYVLLEAAVLGRGETLGPVGSVIVADTFRTLVLTSKISILTPGVEWDPSQGASDLELDFALTTIPEILVWLDDKEPIIDPLQDSRLQTGA